MNSREYPVNVVISSDDSLSYFPENNPHHFTSVIDPPIRLEGAWLVGLKDIFITFKNLRNVDLIGGGHLIVDVHLIQANGTVLGGRESTLLKRVVFYARNRKCTSMYESFPHCDLTRVTSCNIDRLELVLKVRHPTNLPLHPQSASSATLVFTR